MLRRHAIFCWVKELVLLPRTCCIWSMSRRARCACSMVEHCGMSLWMSHLFLNGLQVFEHLKNSYRLQEILHSNVCDGQHVILVEFWMFKLLPSKKFAGNYWYYIWILRFHIGFIPTWGFPKIVVPPNHPF